MRGIDATPTMRHRGRMAAARVAHHTDEPRADRHVVFVVFDGLQSLDLTGPLEVFAGASTVLERRHPDAPRYRVHVVSPDGGPIRAESGLTIVADTPDTIPRTIDSLVIPGGNGVDRAADDHRYVTLVQELAGRSRRLVTVCSGTFMAAAAGLLEGRRVTTHWARAGQLVREHPTLDVDPDPIYVRDGDVWTSGGVTAGVDLALAIVEDDHDARVAQTVARWLVMFLRRPGGQTQFAAPVWTDRADSGPIRDAQEAVEANPGADHRVGLLAARVNMSERHFTRCFRSATGISPAQYVIGVRVEAARRALETTGDTVDAIARRCGFGTAETLRRTFARRLGVSPDQYRGRFRTAVATPAH